MSASMYQIAKLLSIGPAHAAQASGSIDPREVGLTFDERLNMLVFRSPYDPGMVDQLKRRIPATDRKWNPPEKPRRWVVTPTHAQTIIDLAWEFYGVQLTAPDTSAARPQPFTTILDVRYIAPIRQRDSGDENAFAYSNGDWSVIFTKRALLQWFGETEDSTSARTGPGLYRVLGIPRDADASAIKKAFRRMALQWHPDHCKEANAAEQFQRISDAYQTLSNAGKRARYNVALEMTGEIERPQFRAMQDVWIPPLRCGLILCSGEIVLGRYVVASIAQWEDIQNEKGEVLVTSFDIEENRVEERWVKPEWRDA